MNCVIRRWPILVPPGGAASAPLRPSGQPRPGCGAAVELAARGAGVAVVSNHQREKTWEDNLLICVRFRFFTGKISGVFPAFFWKKAEKHRKKGGNIFWKESGIF